MSQIKEQKSNQSLTSMKDMDLSVMMVKMRGLYFTHDRFGSTKYTLENIDMSFPKGAIYGLLGPSGCGKTTLLKTILGLKKPLKGSVEVNGRKPSDPLNKIPGSGVGFQPQETAIYEEFSIEETLNYFADIYGIRSADKQKRIHFLIDFLQLPNRETKVKYLSGGEQRRVSIAVALVHNPPFLILDEPTVGVDPLLRQKIWDHLVDLSRNEKISILITTHYVEEARKAQVVALMRKGRLLVEQTPKVLMTHFGVNGLEDVFIKVCMVTEGSTQASQLPKSFIETIEQKKSQQKGPTPTKLPQKSQMELKLEPTFCKRFQTLSWKNALRLWRQPLMLGFQVLSPSVSMILFLLCVGRVPENMNIAVFNGDAQSPFNASCPDRSQLFLDSIDTVYLNPVTFPSNESAIQSVKKGKTFGALVIAKGFSGFICSRVMDKYSTLTAGSITFYFDMTDYTIYNTIKKELWEAHDKFINEVFKDINVNKMNQSVSEDMLKPIIEFAIPPIYGSVDITFRDFMTPGMVICVVFILAVGLTALSFVSEKKEGVMERTIMAGVRIYEILMTQIFVQIFVLFVQIVILLIIIFLIFSIENKGQYYYIIPLILMQGVLGMTYGLVISIIAADGQSALMIAFGSFFPFLLLSGVFWPIEGMHYSFQMISHFMPQTTSVIALRYIMLKGWGITEMYVWLGYTSTVVWIVIFTSLSILLSSV